MDSKNRNIIALVTIAVLAAVAIWQVWPPAEKITQGLDIKGGLSVILSVEPLSGDTLSEDTMTRVEDILVERVNGFGVNEATVQRQGQTAFLIQLPGVANAQEALKLLGEPGKLEFVDYASITDTATAALIVQQLEAASSTEPTATLPKLTDDPYAGTYEAFMTGEVITDAQVSTDQYGNPSVSLTMNDTGIEIWADVTTRLSATQGQVVIILDGIAKSAPAVQEPILTGDTEISGTFTVDEAKALAAVLQSGAMPAQIEIVESHLDGRVATGGGAPMGDANRWFFEDAGTAVFHLGVSLDEALARTRGDASRPLLARGADDVHRLYASRLPLYRNLGTEVLTDGRTPEEIAAEILARLAVR